MRIEDQIRVATFPSIYQKVSINLIYTTTWADVRLQTGGETQTRTVVFLGD